MNGITLSGAIYGMLSFSLFLVALEGFIQILKAASHQSSGPDFFSGHHPPYAGSAHHAGKAIGDEGKPVRDATSRGPAGRHPHAEYWAYGRAEFYAE